MILCMCINIFFFSIGYSKKIKLPTSMIQSNYVPRGKNQELYVKYLEDPSIKIVAGVGSAGTGKTLFACDAAIKMLYSGSQNVKKIILTRPLVFVEKRKILDSYRVILTVR